MLYLITDTESGHMILIPSLIIVSLLVFAIVMFLLGILFGMLFLKYIPKSSKKNDVEPASGSGSVPLYDKIRLPSVPMDQDFMKFKDNEAYSHNIIIKF